MGLGVVFSVGLGVALGFDFDVGLGLGLGFGVGLGLLAHSALYKRFACFASMELNPFRWPIVTWIKWRKFLLKKGNNSHGPTSLQICGAECFRMPIYRAKYG